MAQFLKQVVGAMIVALLPAQLAVAGGVGDLVGLDDLINRLGAANIPTGAGVHVSQVEANEGVNYGPNQSDPELAGKTYVAQSGAPGNSGHATLVARTFYGTQISIAPDINTIYLYSAAGWLQGNFLRTSQGAANPPLATPGQVKIFNNSWGGSFGSAAVDNEAMRRADFVVTRDDVIMLHGLPNSGQSFNLMYNSFNGLAVGLTNGTHALGTSLVGVDGPGRMRPDIVAPSSLVSFGVPTVSGAAALMVQTARVVPSLMGNPNAQRSETIKAVLMCGADHRPGWTNNPGTGASRGVTATPLDSTYGVDQVNVNLSHLTLTGNEQNGAVSPPSSVNAQYRGWDLATINMNGSTYYRINVPALADKVSILTTWHRKVDASFASYTLANVNLQLWRIDGAGGLASLVGNAGLPYFSAGNVVSNSSIDNVEHLYIQNLQPGQYTLQVQRADAINQAWDVAVAWLFPVPPSPGDVNGDGVTNIDDLLAIISAWGTCSGCPADIDGNGLVNIDDLLTVINNWTI
jgi:hypothetical protein